MFDFDVDVEQFARLRFLGLGGGNNAVNRMVESGVRGVDSSP